MADFPDENSFEKEWQFSKDTMACLQARAAERRREQGKELSKPSGADRPLAQ